MGAVLCCMRQPSVEHDLPEEDRLSSNSTQYVSPAISFKEQHATSAKTPDKSPLDTPENKYKMIGSMTLEDCLLASPNINPHNHMGGEIQIYKHLPRKFCLPSPEGSQDFFTPRMSFPADTLRAIDETDEYAEGNFSANSVRRNSSGKLGKRVTFRLPEEADIYLYYTPKETFEDCCEF